MGIEKNNILITGLPGIGKTTLIREIIDQLSEYSVKGFYTSEIREKGIRRGFMIISLEGQGRILSHADIQSSFNVSKYGVDIAGFEDLLAEINLLSLESDLVVLDEIGKMECFSNKFRRLVLRLLDSEKFLLATIAVRGTPFIEEIKERSDVQLFEMNRENRDILSSHLMRVLVSGLQKEEKYE